MKSLARAWAVLAIAVAPFAAWAHATLHSADPAAGSTVATAPKQIRQQFNEALEPAFTSVKVVGPDGKDVGTGKALVDKADPKTAVLPLPPLSAGAYKARWSTMGHDGHRIKGEVGFTVKP
jgi:methionine-rich copper-binding protein CopC